jgi:hypothetical protein
LNFCWFGCKWRRASCEELEAKNVDFFRQNASGLMLR